MSLDQRVRNVDTRVGRAHGALTISLVAAVLLASACASRGPTIVSNLSPGVDPASFRTFGFMEPLGTDRPGGIRTPLGSMLVDAVTRELQQRGLDLSEEPEILVNVFVQTEERTEVRTVPTATTTTRTHRHGRYGTWTGYRTDVRQYTRGTLAIDLVDPRARMLVWEAAAQGRLREDLRNLDQGQVDRVVADVMQQFIPLKKAE
jgi:hypothetical protein